MKEACHLPALTPRPFGRLAFHEWLWAENTYDGATCVTYLRCIERVMQHHVCTKWLLWLGHLKTSTEVCYTFIPRLTFTYVAGARARARGLFWRPRSRLSCPVLFCLAAQNTTTDSVPIAVSEYDGTRGREHDGQTSLKTSRRFHEVPENLVTTTSVISLRSSNHERFLRLLTYDAAGPP